MDTLRDLVKEQGIVNIIMDYKEQLEYNEKYKNVIAELKEYNKPFNHMDMYNRNNIFVEYEVFDFEDFKDLAVVYSPHKNGIWCRIIEHNGKFVSNQ